jgi:type I restriction enzyme S subunit
MTNRTREWRDAKLEDLVFFQRGFDITQAQQRPGAHPVISSSGVTSYHDEVKATGPGIIIGRKGTLGSIHFSSVDYWPHDTTLWSKDLKGNHPRFVYYYLHTLDFKRFDVGNSNPTLNRNHIHDLSIRIPPHPVQAEIADILSAYDDLIENNRQRMALLEVSARLLYQEWFVRLRFPGHEHIPVTNGVPEGWERQTLGDCLTLKRGHDLPESARIPGAIPIVSSSGITGFHNAKKADGPGLVTGRYGTLGEVYYVDEDYWPHNTALYVCDFKGNSARVLFFFLKHALHNAQSNNAAVPGLNRNVLHTLRVLWPPRSLRDAFNSFLEPLFRQLASLRRFNEKLAIARDLLLPRLMSGEVVV